MQLQQRGIKERDCIILGVVCLFKKKKNTLNTSGNVFAELDQRFIEPVTWQIEAPALCCHLKKFRIHQSSSKIIMNS